MVNLMRRFQKPLLAVLTAVIIVSFVAFFNIRDYRGASGRASRVATIYGEPVSQLQIEQGARRFEVCSRLQMFELLFPLAMSGSAGKQPEENFVWNSLILRHESAEMGTEPTEAEIADTIKAMPQFQTNGAFDYPKYAGFVANFLPSRGFTEHDFENIVGDGIRVRKIQSLLKSTVQASPAELHEQYALEHQKNEATIFRFKLDDFKTAVQVSDEDVAKAFEEQKDTLKTPEKRQVKVAAFTHAAEQKPQTGPERAEASRILSEKARAFAEEAQKPGADFEALAKAQSVALVETPLFSADEPPAELNKAEAAAQAAFALTPGGPISDVVSTDSGYYVLQLTGTEASRPLTAEEAKPKLIEQLKQERGQEAMRLKATELRTKLDADVKAGKAFEEAAQTAGVPPEKLPPFAGGENMPNPPPDFEEIKQQIGEMKEGDLSEFLPTSTGGIVVHLDKRQPVDEAAFEKEKGRLAQQLENRQGMELFQEWLRDRRTASRLELFKG